MKRIILIILVLILIPLATNAATIFYERVTTYADGTPIEAGKTVVYRAWYTSSPETGPWTAGDTSTEAEIVAPDPLAGATGWYSVSAFIQGVPGSESARGAPASKTMPPLTLSSPPGCKVR